MSVPYLPDSDVGARNWMVTFAATLLANPSPYGLSPADASAIYAAVAALESAYLIAIDPATRTPVAVNQKDTARNAAEQICRTFAQIIKHDAGVTDADKIAIGVRPINNGRSPIACPQTSPIISVIAATPGTHVLRFRDSMTPDRSAKPFGATELQLFGTVGDAIATDPAEARFIGKFTRNPVSISYAAGENRKQATYFARWASRRGEFGPWSLAASFAIAA